MKIEPVINSQISLLKRRNVGLAKLAEAYPMGRPGDSEPWDYDIRQNCEKIADFIKLLKEARELDSCASAEDGISEEEHEGQETDMGLPPLLQRS